MYYILVIDQQGIVYGSIPMNEEKDEQVKVILENRDVSVESWSFLARKFDSFVVDNARAMKAHIVRSAQLHVYGAGRGRHVRAHWQELRRRLAEVDEFMVDLTTTMYGDTVRDLLDHAPPCVLAQRVQLLVNVNAAVDILGGYYEFPIV